MSNKLKKGRQTSYNNRIGLKGDSGFIKQAGEVVISFPFKDCVLEGGMTTEESGREERFLHLQQDSLDIDALFDEKVLTDFRYIDKDGEKKLDEKSDIEFFDEDGELKQNLLIKGNNLLALHTLKSRLAGKVKLIYIDPPYNTGNDGFKYNDNFNHSTWLVFMKNRLEIARELLRDDGIIFISLGATSGVEKKSPEMAYLTVLMDEVFSRENYIDTLYVLNNLKGNNNTELFSNVGEFCLAFSKNIEWVTINEIMISEEDELEKWEEDEFGFWKVGRELKATGENAPRHKRPTMFFPLFIDPNKLTFSLEKNSTHTYELLPIRNGEDVCWNWSREQFIRQKEEVLIFKNGDSFTIKKKQRPEVSDVISKKAKNLFYKPEYSNTASAKHIEELFNKRVFNYTKAEGLIADFIKCGTKENDIVLDYHLGSGTTAAVAHKMGRRWIGIEQMDYIEDVAKVRLQKVIGTDEEQGEQGGISKSVGWTGGGSFVYFELKKYNQELVDRIKNAKTKDELNQTYQEMNKNGFLQFWFDKKEFEKDENYKALPLEEQKKRLKEIIDLNHLYLNKPEMGDTKHKVSKEEVTLTNKFYGEKN